jgi:hypothetical protein
MLRSVIDSPKAIFLPAAGMAFWTIGCLVRPAFVALGTPLPCDAQLKSALTPPLPLPRTETLSATAARIHRIASPKHESIRIAITPSLELPSLRRD